MGIALTKVLLLRAVFGGLHLPMNMRILVIYS